MTNIECICLRAPVGENVHDLVDLLLKRLLLAVPLIAIDLGVGELGDEAIALGDIFLDEEEESRHQCPICKVAVWACGRDQLRLTVRSSCIAATSGGASSRPSSWRSWILAWLAASARWRRVISWTKMETKRGGQSVSADALTRKLEPPPPSRTDPVELGDGVVELLRLLRIRLAFGLKLRDL